jgi:hypothetical protein
MSPHRFINLIAIFIFIGPGCRATEVVIAVASDGVVIASDSKQVSGSSSGWTNNPELANKIVVMNDRVAIATVGIAKVLLFMPNGKVRYSFDSSQLLDGVKHSLPTNASVSLIENVVINKLKRAMDGLSPYVADGSIQQQDPTDMDFIDFDITGYESGIPVVHKILVKCDWSARKFSSPIFESKYPRPNKPHNSYIGFFGWNRSVINMQNPASPESAAANARYPDLIRGMYALAHGKGFTSTEAVNIASQAILLEAEFNPERVGPPINIVVLSSKDAPIVKTLRK